MYYNKNVKKSNTPTIFTGKEKRKNELVLESLLHGEKTTMEIARFISKKEGGHRKSVYSIIDRKGGALRRLSRPGKAFIEKKNQKWSLTPKGIAAALVLTGDTEIVLPVLRKTLEKTNLKGSMLSLLRVPFLKSIFSEEMLEELYNMVASGEVLELIRRGTVRLVDQGVNLEDLNEEVFNNIMVAQVVSHMATNKVWKGLTRRKWT